LIIQTNRTGGSSDEALCEGVDLGCPGGSRHVSDGFPGHAVPLTQSDDLLPFKLHVSHLLI
jgi:hypothetical protein